MLELRPARARRLAGVLTALLLAGCGGVAEPPPARHVVLVTVDTLRADHLSCYGHFRETTPVLDRLAREGVRFERALATSGTTLPSHLSMMTGLLPHQHGMLSNASAARGAFRPGAGRRTAAELLADAGWATAAFVSATPVGSRSGLQAGFEVFSAPVDPSATALETNARLFAWLEERAAGADERPLFLWVHYWDVHEPNLPPEPYASLYGDDPRLDALFDARGIRPRTLNRAHSPLVRARHFAPRAYLEREDGAIPDVPRVGRGELADLFNRYDGDVRYVDDALGALLARLERDGLLQDAVLAVVGDHGQGLGQHDWLEHGRLTGDILRVPLIVRLPGGEAAGTVVEHTVSLVDLLPTLLARAAPSVGERLAGQGVAVDVLGSPGGRGWAFSQRTTRERRGRSWADGTRVALADGRWKLVLGPGDALELYDLQADPGERRDVAPAQAALVAELRARVEGILADRPAPDEGAGPVDEDLLRDLEALGYGGDEATDDGGD